jgi:hypothetical protein
VDPLVLKQVVDCPGATIRNDAFQQRAFVVLEAAWSRGSEPLNKRDRCGPSPFVPKALRMTPTSATFLFLNCAAAPCCSAAQCLDLLSASAITILQKCPRIERTGMGRMV